jgi:hypothetical protein
VGFNVHRGFESLPLRWMQGKSPVLQRGHPCSGGN